MEWYYIVLISVISLLILFLITDFIIAYYLTNLVTKFKKRSLQEALKIEYKINKFSKEEYENDFKFVNYNVMSPFGYNLKVTYIKKQVDKTFADNKERAIIFSHGWTSCRFSMLPYAKIYLKLGFHVFLYDHRNHCESDVAVTTMGLDEAIDMQKIVEFVKNKFNGNVIVGTHGESMGSSVAMIHAGKYKSVSFVVDDCGYSDLKDLLYHQCKDVRHIIPFPTMIFARILFKKYTKYSMSEINVVKYLANCDDIAMLFIHGSNDDFVNTSMAYDCYDAKDGFKMIKIFENSTHATCILDHPDEYYKTIYEFLFKSHIID